MDERTHALLGQIARRVDQIARGVQETTMEVVKTPSVFTIAPIDTSRFDPRTFWSKPIRITLWCTYPGEYHPVLEASYKTSLPKEWFVEALPYLRATLSLLKLAPIIQGGFVGYDANQFASNLEILETICNATEDETNRVGVVTIPEKQQSFTSNRRRVEGPDDRAIKQLLLKLGAAESFRPLHKVFTPTGGVEWVCKTHLARYLSDQIDEPIPVNQARPRHPSELLLKVEKRSQSTPVASASPRPSASDQLRFNGSVSAGSLDVALASFEEFRKQIEPTRRAIADEPTVLMNMRRAFHSLPVGTQFEVVRGAFIAPDEAGAPFRCLVKELPEELQGGIFRQIC